MTDKDFQMFMVEHMTKLSEEVKSLRQDVARIENKHGEKLSALFDGYQAITGTLAGHTERLDRIENKLETHSVKIEVLDKTKSNKRTAK